MAPDVELDRLLREVQGDEEDKRLLASEELAGAVLIAQILQIVGVIGSCPRSRDRITGSTCMNDRWIRPEIAQK